MDNIDLTNDHIWREIPGYDGKYYVSRFGEIYSKKRRKIRKQTYDKDSYLKVILNHKSVSKTYRVHRLVATLFIPNPDNKPQVNHIDTIKYNNAVDNLEWCTINENNEHALNMGKRSDNMAYQKKIIRIDLTTNETVIYDSIVNATKDLFPEYMNLNTFKERKRFIYSRTSYIRLILKGKRKKYMNYFFKEL